jgi:hypothetical protein
MLPAACWRYFPLFLPAAVIVAASHTRLLLRPHQRVPESMGSAWGAGDWSGINEIGDPIANEFCACAFAAAITPVQCFEHAALVFTTRRQRWCARTFEA